MPFLIDGYNLLWAVQKYGEGLEAIEDTDLCRILGRFLTLTGQKAEIIFDGTGPPEKQAFDNIKGLDVLFQAQTGRQILSSRIKLKRTPHHEGSLWSAVITGFASRPYPQGVINKI